ncbi:mammalian cell entry protein, partial [Mycolicibacterium diernhoferi]
RINGAYSSRLCAQYLAPIVKNRQMNFPPLGENLFVGQAARPNEITYSENRLRPDFVPPAIAEAPAAATTDPAAGLPGMLLPGAGG